MPGEILRPDFKKTEKNKSREIGSSFSLKDENIARKIATRSLEREGHDFFYYINLDEQEENKEETITALVKELKEDGVWKIFSKTEDPNPLKTTYRIINGNANSTFFNYELVFTEEDLITNNVVDLQERVLTKPTEGLVLVGKLVRLYLQINTNDLWLSKDILDIVDQIKRKHVVPGPLLDNLLDEIIQGEWVVLGESPFTEKVLVSFAGGSAKYDGAFRDYKFEISKDKLLLINEKIDKPIDTMDLRKK